MRRHSGVKAEVRGSNCRLLARWAFQFCRSNVVRGEAMAGKHGGLPAEQDYWLTEILQLEVRHRVRESNNISYIYMYRINFHKLKVLNDINTDWSILFFFDLKDYISYCKDVYRYFNLSSVNFFVAGLKYCLFFSMALWHWSLYYFNITRLWEEIQVHKMCIAFDSILLGWSFYRFSKKKKSFKSASPSIFFIQ